MIEYMVGCFGTGDILGHNELLKGVKREAEARTFGIRSKVMLNCIGELLCK